MIDLRSDTLTRPTPAMRQAIAKADVGDDVFGEDPSVRALEEEVAALTGKEAALFVSTGTMGNQLAIRCHTRPGDEVIVGEGAHPVWYECGASAVLSGVQFAVAGAGGLYTAEEMIDAIKPKAYYYPRTSLVCIENTHNRGGGRVFAQKEIVRIGKAAHERGLAFHLDGARIWNASVASGLSVKELAAPFDTVSVCFSKGLGAPVGSVLAGTRALVEDARRLRKMWGGGTRQAGILAAAASYALANHRARLGEDHLNAKVFAGILAQTPHAHVDLANVETNIVNVELDAPLTGDVVAEKARALGVALNASGPRRLRAVTHLDVSRDDVEKGAKILASAIQACAR